MKEELQKGKKALEVFPFEQEFQRSLLALLLDLKEGEVADEKVNLLLPAYVGYLEPKYFTFEQYRFIWEVACAFYSRYRMAPTYEVFEHEINSQPAEPLKIWFYLQELRSLLKKSTIPADYILAQVDDFLRFQNLKDILQDSARLLKKGELDYVSLVEMVRRAMTLSRQAGEDSMLRYKDPKRFETAGPVDCVSYIATGYPKLDISLNGGLGRGMLGVVGAYTGIGKTMWLANIAFNALLAGFKVLYVSLEQSVRDIAYRIDEIYATTVGFTNDVSIIRTTDKLKALPGELVMKDYPIRKLRVQELSAFLFRLDSVYGFKPDLVIVDYGALMQGEAHRERWETIGDIYEGLRGIAVEHNVALWTACQLHREAIKTKYQTRSTVEPVDLIYYVRDSSIVAETCDRFLVLTSEKDRSEYVITLAKTRTGTEGSKIRYAKMHQKLVEIGE